jgi:hypothetical protein
MIHWQDPAFRQRVRIATDPVEQFVNNYLDTWAWWFLHCWYMPLKMPGMYSDVDKFVSQFTLNGVKSSNLCKPKSPK